MLKLIHSFCKKNSQHCYLTQHSKHLRSISYQLISVVVSFYSCCRSYSIDEYSQRINPNWGIFIDFLSHHLFPKLTTKTLIIFSNMMRCLLAATSFFKVLSSSFSPLSLELIASWLLLSLNIQLMFSRINILSISMLYVHKSQIHIGASYLRMEHQPLPSVFSTINFSLNYHVQRRN